MSRGASAMQPGGAACPFRALARVEWREHRRHPLRTMLILLLVALPVAAITASGLLARIMEPTPAERAAAEVGAATLRIDGMNTFAAREAARAALPAGTRIEQIFRGGEEVHTPGRRLRAALLAIEPPIAEAVSLHAGMFHIVAGRTPAHAGEVALSRSLLDAAGRSIGDEVALTYGAARRITGIVCDPENLDAAIVVRTLSAVENNGRQSLLVQLDDSRIDETTARLRNLGFEVCRASEAAAGDDFAIGAVFALGCIGCFQAALVIAAAFAIGLRRRQYEIGLLGSFGASPRLIGRTIAAMAGVLGFVGSVVGVLLGVFAALLLSRYADGWNRRLNGEFELSLGVIFAALVMGVATASLAAGLPARHAARLPIREALSGRRPPPPRTLRFLALGGALLLIGIIATFAIPASNSQVGAMCLIAGPIFSLIGVGVCSPWLLDLLSRRAAALPLGWRLAVRDAGRFRLRNGPVVTAVVAGMSMTVAAAIFVASFENTLHGFPAPLRDDQLLVAGAGADEVVASILARELSAIASAPLLGTYTADGQPVRVQFPAAATESPRRAWLACGDDRLLVALGGELARAAFQRGALIAFEPARGDRAVLSPWLDGREISRVDVVAATPAQRVREPLFLLESSQAAALGLETGPPLNQSTAPWLLRLPAGVTGHTVERARRAVSASPGVIIDAACLHARPARPYFYGLLLLCGLAAMTVVFIATALSAAESAADERVLIAIGASPGLLRGQWAARAGYLAVVGCSLAVPVGFIIATAVLTLANMPLGFVVPARELLLIAFGVPLVVYCVAWLLSARAAGAAQRWRAA